MRRPSSDRYQSMTRETLSVDEDPCVVQVEPRSTAVTGLQPWGERTSPQRPDLTTSTTQSGEPHLSDRVRRGSVRGTARIEAHDFLSM